MAILMVLLAALAGTELSIWRANAHILSICFIDDRYKTTADSNFVCIMAICRRV